jgi:membrane protein
VSKRPRLTTALRLTLAAYQKHNASRFGAALAFYIVFAIAPTLLIAIGVAGLVFGRPAAEREIVARIGGSFGTATGAAIAAMIKDAAPRRAGWLATSLGIISLYFSLAGVYRQIKDALRTIWPGKPRHEHAGIIVRIERTIASTLLVFGVAAILLLSVIADAAIALTGRYASSRLAGGELLWHAAQLIVSTIVLTAIFAAVFRYLPQARVTWSDVRLGAAVTAILFVVGKLGLGIYLGKAAVGSAFGAAGSIVVVLLWSYWSAQIFFFGLEFTHVYAQEREPDSAAAGAWRAKRAAEPA